MQKQFSGWRPLKVQKRFIAVTTVLPDGRLVRLGRPVVKNVAGYDLPKLFIGAYGTLGLITEATLKVLPCPRYRKSLIIPLEDVKQSLDVGQKLVETCLVASALLLITHSQNSACRELARVAGVSPLYLIYTAEGLPEDVHTELNQVKSVLQTGKNPAGIDLESASGSELWADWLRSAMESPVNVWRVGAPPKELSRLIESVPDQVDFQIDLASGMNLDCQSSQYRLECDKPTQEAGPKFGRICCVA